MKIIFIEPIFPGTVGYEVVFPFGYASLGAVLQREGHEIEYLFPIANRQRIQDVIDHISNTDADAIGIGGLLSHLPTVIELVRLIKDVRPDIPIVLGGQMVTYTPELALKKTGADFGIAGEGEVSLSKLLNSIEYDHDYSNIPGLVFRQGGLVISNGMSEIMPLDNIPLPNWDDFPMDYYMYAGSHPIIWSDRTPKRVFTWMLSRGCPMRCNFCVSGCDSRYKTISQSIRELKEIVSRFDPDYVIFVDNYFTRNEKYVFDLCEAFIANEFHFKFSATCRADFVNPRLLLEMKKAGCEMIFYGLECANNDILRFMSKGITVEQMLEALQMTKDVGIHPMVSIMFGQPGETFNDFFNSLKITLMSINSEDPVPGIPSIMPISTFPGTPIYLYAQQRGYFDSDEDYWEKYGYNSLINYNLHNYTNESIGKVIDLANAMYRWKYYQSMADHHLKSLQELNLFYIGSKDVSPNLPIEHLSNFLDRCLRELVFGRV